MALSLMLGEAGLTPEKIEPHAEVTLEKVGRKAASTTLLQFLLMVAGWLHRQQAAVIEYLSTENRLLRERLGGRQIIFTDTERRNLAEKARTVGHKTLRKLGTIVTPKRCFAGTRAGGAQVDLH